ncbi:retinol-binding protein 1.1 isoform X2 [Scophthalmus maximus]|uniref:retinol-binding protein 1.1 isoform X2 n=1 Tax=Scophthalmus maximus TaxID=52904 RepID=UPI0015E0A6B6|nr:retinol-binding protein 1.1 isoform X2 [Scophthalmus maximus]
MPPGRLSSEVYWACPTGRRPRGRPKTRWRDYLSRLAWKRLRIPPGGSGKRGSLRPQPTSSLPESCEACRDTANMPVDLNGYWKMISSDNFEEYLKALDVNVAIRKIATLLKPDKDIVHEGDHIIIKTLSTFKNYNMDFHVGKEFEEDLSGVDDRKCMTTIAWEGDKLVCVQKGEIEGRGWTHWVDGDELHLELRAGGVVSKQVFKKT